MGNLDTLQANAYGSMMKSVPMMCWLRAYSAYHAQMAFHFSVRHRQNGRFANAQQAFARKRCQPNNRARLAWLILRLPLSRAPVTLASGVADLGICAVCS